MVTITSRVIAAAILVGVSSAIHAANVPNFSKPVDLNVREQPVEQFSMALFRQLNVPLKLHDDFEGLVNGRFNSSARDIYNDLTRAFDFVIYYDGAVAHAYKSNGIARTLLPMSRQKAVKLSRMANSLKLPDSRNTLSSNEAGLLATGTPRFIEQIQELLPTISITQTSSKPARRQAPAPQPVAEQKPTYPRIYRVFSLKHAWAEDTNFNVGGKSVSIPGVATLLKQLVTEGEMIYDQFSPANGQQEESLNTVPGLRGQGLQLVNGASAASQTQISDDRFRSTSSSSKERIKIVADTRLNAVIIHDTADRMPAYEDLIRKLDVPSKMVEIEATIIDINTDRSRELGINWRYQGENAAFLFGGGTPGDDFFEQGSTTITQGRGGVLSFMAGEPGEFLARVRALEERGAAKIVSKPHVITLSDVEAVLGATTEFFVRVAGQEEVDLFNVPVGTLLRVTPHVFTEAGQHKIKLLVNIEDGSQSSSQQVDSIPVVERASISTQAVIAEGDSLLVGGLVRDSYRKSDYRIPLLGSIPGLGRFFRTEVNSSSRIERLFLITPRVEKGLGFNGNANLPTLQGESNEIIADSRIRGDNVAWPKQETRRFWPKEYSSGKGRNAAYRTDQNGQTSPAGPQDKYPAPQNFSVRAEDFAIQQGPSQYTDVPAKIPLKEQIAIPVQPESNGQLLQTVIQPTTRHAVRANVQNFNNGQELPVNQQAGTTPANKSATRFKVEQW